MTSSPKLVVEWGGLPRFPAKMTLVHSRATWYWENLELVVVLVLESKALYYKITSESRSNTLPKKSYSAFRHNTDPQNRPTLQKL